MAEYIERNSAMEKILEIGDLNYDGMPAKIGTTHAALIIRNLPAAAVAPVRHGRWIDGEKNPVPWDEYNPNCPLYSAYCSECGKWLVGSDEYPASGLYCPNCGCLMLGGDRDDKVSDKQRK